MTYSLGSICTIFFNTRNMTVLHLFRMKDPGLLDSGRLKRERWIIVGSASRCDSILGSIYSAFSRLESNEPVLLEYCVSCASDHSDEFWGGPSFELAEYITPKIQRQHLFANLTISHLCFADLFWSATTLLLDRSNNYQWQISSILINCIIKIFACFNAPLVQCPWAMATDEEARRRPAQMGNRFSVFGSAAAARIPGIQENCGITLHAGPGHLFSQWASLRNKITKHYSDILLYRIFLYFLLFLTTNINMLGLQNCYVIIV
jgi:hypothetical protein